MRQGSLRAPCDVYGIRRGGGGLNPAHDDGSNAGRCVHAVNASLLLNSMPGGSPLNNYAMRAAEDMDTYGDEVLWSLGVSVLFGFVWIAIIGALAYYVVWTIIWAFGLFFAMISAGAFYSVYRMQLRETLVSWEANANSFTAEARPESCSRPAQCGTHS